MKVLTIAEAARQLENIKDEHDPFLLQILQDERKGVTTINTEMAQENCRRNSS